MKGGAPLDEKCILDPQRDCIGKAEAAKLEGRIKALEEWREVPRSSKLGRKLRMYYPWVNPVVDESGEPTDVEIQQAAPDGEQEARKAALAQEARRRGYHRRGKVRPKNIMPFLAAKGEKP